MQAKPSAVQPLQAVILGEPREQSPAAILQQLQPVLLSPRSVDKKLFLIKLFFLKPVAKWARDPQRVCSSQATFLFLPSYNLLSPRTPPLGAPPFLMSFPLSPLPGNPVRTGVTVFGCVPSS